MSWIFSEWWIIPLLVFAAIGNIRIIADIAAYFGEIYIKSWDDKAED